MTKEEFLNGVGNWSNHRHLLWPALEATGSLPVLELGAGEGSTPYLRKYCDDSDRKFRSYDSNLDWARQMDVYYAATWEEQKFWDHHYGVCLLDLAPGEYRRIALMKLTKCDIIVIHDSEPAGWNASDYRVRQLFGNFKFVKDYEATKPAAWATALSNTIDVTKFEI